MAELDKGALAFRDGYITAFNEAYQAAKWHGLVELEQAAFALRKKNSYIGVYRRAGGPYSLFCYDCGEWVPSTANAEMAKEGAFAHSHSCPPIKESSDQA